MDKNRLKAKTYSDCYMYRNNVYIYEKSIKQYMSKSEILDKNSDYFIGIMNGFKLTYPRWLYKFINSDKLLFLIPDRQTPVNKAFNTFACTKKQGDKTKTVVLVNAQLLQKHIKSGKFVLASTTESIMQGYCVSAFTAYHYLTNPTLFTNNSVIVNIGAEIYARLFLFVLNYLYKVQSIPKLVAEIEIMTKVYYYYNLLNMSMEKSIQLASRKSTLSSLEIEVLNLDDKDLYKDISTFVTEGLANMRTMEKLTFSLFMEKWIQLFGTGTEFATELLPPFLTMLTNQYVSSYASNINSIQNIIGHSNKVGAEIMKIGDMIYG